MIEKEENDFSKENQIGRMYLRNNSNETQKQQQQQQAGERRSSSSSLLAAESQVVELEKHVKNLHHLLAQEKSAV